MNVSAVIVNWNSGAALRECLDCLVDRTACRFLNIVVVDNASSDGSQSAAQRFPGVVLVQNDENRGFASGVNQGLAVARGDVVLVLNPDVVLTPSTVPALVEFVTRRADVAVVGPKLVNPDGSVQGSARRAPSAWTGLFGRSTPLTKLMPNNPFSRRELPGLWNGGREPVEVDWLAGACLLVRREAVNQVGVMDERFFLFFEDADWCIRFRQAGWKVYYCPEAEAMHTVGQSRRRRRLRSTMDLHRSAYYFMRKHHFRSRWHPATPVLMIGLLMHFLVRVVQSLATQAKDEGPASAVGRSTV